MKYISTRGTDTKEVFSAYAIKTGLASDKGLYMPNTIPTLTLQDIEKLIDSSYPERAASVLARYLDDYTYEELLEDAREAYSKEKFSDFPAKLTDMKDGTYMLELWHGPTSAFKDMALQIMPRLFVRALRKCGEERTALILVATSGDTGKAALEGYRDVEGTKVKVFYPIDGVSRVQKLQMQTQCGSNVSVSGIEGNFDDAQSGVKEIFADEGFAKYLDEQGVFLSSANSINWGRLAPQIAYYVSAYCDMVKCGAIKLGESIDVSVPTGNFGNIFACYLAKLMGLPIGKLICASNKNDVLTEFLSTGVYNKNRIFHTTMSPSMDILISSNLERLLYVTLGQEKTAVYMDMLATEGKYVLSGEDLEKITKDFVGYSSDEERTAATIKAVYENKNCLIDPHTAVAFYATKRYIEDNKAERRILTVSTASAYKFAADVYTSLTGTHPMDELEALSMLETLTSEPIPAPLRDLGKRKIIHTSVISKTDMKDAVSKFAKE
ncbi:MAG: threonine synthase [Clostridia bacterium]|nr:threonine synthase [Clostridia bacterium]